MTRPAQQLIREMGWAGWLHEHTLPPETLGLCVGGVYVFFLGPLSDDYTQKVLCVFLLIKTDGGTRYSRPQKLSSGHEIGIIIR